MTDTARDTLRDERSSPWGPREAILGVLILLVVPVWLGLLLGIGGWAMPEEPGLGLLLLLALPGSLLAAGYALYLSYRYRAPAVMGLVGCEPRHLLAAIVLAPVFVLVSALWGQALQALGVEGEQAFLVALRSASAPFVLVTAVLWGVLGAPLVEELLFRGLILSGLRQRLSGRLSLVLSALAFALLHFEYPPAVPMLFLLGLLLGLLRQRSGSLLPPVLLHALNNGFAFFLLLFER